MKITEQLGLERETELQKRFREMTKGLGKAQTREIERNLFKSRPIKTYLGQRSGKSDFSRRTLKIVFPKEEDITDIMGKFMILNTYTGYNSYDVLKLLKLISMVNNKELVYDEEKGAYTYGERKRQIIRKANRRRLTKVGLK